MGKSFYRELKEAWGQSDDPWQSDSVEDNDQTKYDRTKTALDSQIARARPFDFDKKLAAQLKVAEGHYEEQKFEEALSALDQAGQMATRLIAESGKVDGHADPLSAAPELAELIAQRNEQRKQLQTLERSSQPDEDALKDAREKAEQIDEKIEAAQKRLNEQGISPKQRGAEYADEDKRMGEWRNYTEKEKQTLKETLQRKDEESAEEFAQREYELSAEQQRIRELGAKRASSTDVTTHMFSDQQRESSKIDVVDGKLYGGNEFDGQGAGKGSPQPLAANDRREFVMDRDGQMYQFQEAASAEKDGKKVTVHHSSPLAGAEVASAGKIGTEHGEITSVSNLSGHYKPGVAQMIQMLEILLKKGAFLDQTWVDAEGQPPKGKAAEVVQSCALLKAAVRNCSEEVHAKKDSTERRDIDRVEQLQQSVTNLNAQVEKARKILEKLGVTPANRAFGPNAEASKKAQVQFLDGAGKLTGVDVKKSMEQVDEMASNVQDFLKSGGGNKETSQEKLAAKKQVHDELTQKLQPTRNDLDERAESRVEEFTKDKLREMIEARLKNPPQPLEEKDSKGEPIPREVLDRTRAELEANRAQMRKALERLKDPTEEQLKELLASMDNAFKSSALSIDQARQVQDQVGVARTIDSLRAQAKEALTQCKKLSGRADDVAELLDATPSSDRRFEDGDWYRSDEPLEDELDKVKDRLEEVEKKFLKAETAKDVDELENLLSGRNFRTMESLETDLNNIEEWIGEYARRHKAELEQRKLDEEQRKREEEERNLAAERDAENKKQAHGNLSLDERDQLIEAARTDAIRRANKAKHVPPSNYSPNPYDFTEDYDSREAFEKLPPEVQEALIAEETRKL